ENADAEDFLRTRVVGDAQSRLLLNHFSLLDLDVKARRIADPTGMVVLPPGARAYQRFLTTTGGSRPSSRAERPRATGQVYGNAQVAPKSGSADGCDPPAARLAGELEALGVVLVDGAAMGDADQNGVGRLGADQLVQRVLQPLVDRRGGLVEEGDLRPDQQDAGEGQPLRSEEHTSEL